MASSASSVTSSSASGLSVATSASGAAAEAKRRAEEQRQEIIAHLQLYPTSTDKKKKHPVWKESRYFFSRLHDHSNDTYCMDCRKWIANGTFSHVKQHDDRLHCYGAGGSGGGGGGGSSSNSTQLKLHQTFLYPPVSMARYHAAVVGACGRSLTAR